MVSASEHRRNASSARPGSVYMNSVRPEIARTRAGFKAAWNEYKLAKPDKYSHTLRLNGTQAPPRVNTMHRRIGRG